VNWIYDISTWLLVLLSILSCSIFGVGGMLLSRRWVRKLHRTECSQNDVVSYFLAAASVFYGVTLGLITVGVWTNYSNAQDKVDAEAEAIAGMYRAAEGFDDSRRALLQQDLIRYTSQVINISWPNQKRGVPSLGSGLMLERLQQNLLTFSPKTPADQILQTQVLSQFNVLVDAKHARMNSVGVGIPSAMWSLVLLGAAVTIAITWYFDITNRSMHICMIMMLSCLLGLIIALVAAFDNPFRGDISVSPEPLERMYTQMEQGLKVNEKAAVHLSQVTPSHRGGPQ
jgi:hypothetical protein